ncbi:heme lyase CcmF/NrfE family subunit [Leucothrix arctica]|uniref:C-type cytochrome biogenesis protein CcmF n=1 Tax=Leucothrix arctica TaxID=1481894 RepID=A0A317C9G3_9GAMM|nr:heme lyase CcmF/NrfE family subunit [Leucothrix arctica]PWQ94997.1 c-type cytochrome biogenesis protein CcmF [Leucothrix arctica]
MLPEIGHFALVLALVVAIVQSVFPILGAATNNAQWIALAKPTARAQLLCLIVSFACLTASFLISDFSVLYVASNSNTLMPTIYKVSAVWGAHEGSLLLWVLILAVWAYLVSVFSKGISAVMLARVLSVMGMIGVGFLLFTLMTSNPFERLFPIPLEGKTLNPLLQDPGLAIHPPMLYMGYVGFSVAFAFAIAAMLGGKLDAAWARWARPWTNIAWVFLTIGIALGSWWAYYELGWGGWWFWDPVENASLMPWLVGTALIHSLAVTEKRAAFKSWTVLLAIFAFSLSLLGTFLVRSGVLTSVHAFASDPERGLFILIFLILVVGSSLLLYAFRAPKLKSTGTFDLVSREMGLLVNNIALIAMTVTVLLGTLYPLFVDSLGGGKISVGPPYFNTLSIPLGAVLASAMGFGLFLRWKKDKPERVFSKVRWVLLVALVTAFLVPILLMDFFDIKAVLGVFLASWVSLTALLWVQEQGRSPFKLPLAVWGASIAHIGFAVMVAGITLTSVYSTEKDVRLVQGQNYEMSGYSFLFNGVKEIQGPNYIAQRGEIVVTRGSESIVTLHPEKRNYGQDTMPMTEAGIDGGFFRDLFVALGEPLGNDAWSVRIYHKPVVNWVWLGAALMSLGGLFAAFDKRYRRVRRREEKPVVQQPTKSDVKEAVA